MSVVIAIDGPSASGKGTLAHRLAQALGYHCLESGLLYRRVGLNVVKQGGVPTDPAFAVPAAQALTFADIAQSDDLRTIEAGQYASQCFTLEGVRMAVRELQRQFSRQEPGVVIDGRDIGTVICPQAHVKIYLTASAETRAARRFAELEGKGLNITYQTVLHDIINRDTRDIHNPADPLSPAKDATLLDTTTLTPDQTFAAALRIVTEKLGM